jgi:HNH endonuclease
MMRAARQRRRARKLSGGESFTTQEWTTLKRQYGYRCVCCWKPEAVLKALGRTLSPDHIIALTKGGLDHVTNIQPLCHGKGGCNNRKHAKYVDFCTS